MRRVLVVEDETSIRELIALNLQMAGYQVLEAGSAEQGLALLSQGQKCDAAVLDALFGELMSRAVLERLELPEGVECAVRGEGERRVRILMNHNARPVTALGRELGPFGVEVTSI